jgi:hypothetical protein
VKKLLRPRRSTDLTFESDRESVLIVAITMSAVVRGGSMGRGAFRALASQKCVAPEKWSPLGANLLGAELYIYCNDTTQQ